ncbi:ATP-dependent DNA ligase [Niabella ginsenosidivorans]|uniref:DNA ligase (ATP) n=1 Tax=Niabella ginsenosidivorans TaxID=1176587 RepID=A0A1A9I7K8_9BACT|nr:ATP-dependent DNA ligase [Niabella ginsenosidivorans]ANH82642.1 ATP-dependent DNA ligase [Niabella ginsenosidivorans]
MKDFVQLFQEIDSSTKTSVKVAALVKYFRQATDRDLLWAITLLIGNRPRRPVTTTNLRLWMARLTGLPLWLIEDSYYIVGDLAETLAHLAGNAPGEDTAQLTLAGLISALRELATLTVEEQEAYITLFWKQHTVEENFVFNKLITGNFRMGVSRQLVIRALAQHLEKDEKEIAHRLMGKWDPDHETPETLFEAPSAGQKIFLPYPFFLSYPLEGNPGATLGAIGDWYLEKKFDGIRGQLIVRNHQVFVWSRGEELVTDKFPEFDRLKELLPDGTVIDGEIIPWKNGQLLPFGQMQTRIGRKKLSAKHLTEVPIIMICFDLLEHEGADIRSRPLEERRMLLSQLLNQPSVNSVLQLSRLLDLKSWEEAARFRTNARDYSCEGLMIKRINSPYETGRRRGNWWKWKTEPMTVDAVLIYAQGGSGRRANLFTDYTFAVWDNDRLVPFTKAYSGLTDKEIYRLDRWIKAHTLEKFGPVRSVEPQLVFEIAFEGIQESKRHKSGVALRFPRILRWREDKPATEANTLADLAALL